MNEIKERLVLSDIKDMQIRINKLENLVGALIKRIDNDKYYANADINALRQTDGTQAEGIEKNTADIDYIMIMEDL